MQHFSFLCSVHSDGRQPADSPKTVFSVALLLVHINSFPLGLQVVAELPEIDEKVRDLARWWQQALQVEIVVAGETEASC